jgi:beta-glucosidase
MTKSKSSYPQNNPEGQIEFRDPPSLLGVRVRQNEKSNIAKIEVSAMMRSQRRFKKCVLGVVIIFLAWWTISGWQKTKSNNFPPYRNPNLSIDQRIDDLLPRMTLEEKAHQLATLYPNAVVRLGIPHLQAGEALHGICLRHGTSFPSPLAMGSTWEPEIIERMGTVVAEEARALGTHQVYSPMLGVLIDPRWGRSEESYGEDPYLVSRIGVAYIKGLQGTGDELFNENHIIASAKHYVADGQPLAGLNGTEMDVSIRRLHEIFLPPFRAAVEEAHVGSIMPAHHVLNGIPCHANKYILVEVLRNTYGFEGHIISDNGDIRALHSEKCVAKTPAEAARLALEAGVDQELAIERPWRDRGYGASLRQAIASGEVPVELVDRAVRNVLRSKFRLGLFDDGTPIYPWQDHLASGDEGRGPIEGWPEYVELEHTKAVRGLDKDTNDYFNKLHRLGVPRQGWENIIYDPAHDQLALEVARNAITLLKNDGNLLPLDKGALKRIAVIGPNAEVEILGAYSTPEARHFVTVLDGIRTYVGKECEVLYEEGCSLIDWDKENISDAVKAAQKSDVAILVIGGNELTAKEGEDADDLGLVGHQEKLVKAVYATGVPIVALLLQSRPLSIPWIAENIPAILCGWFLGQETGTAVAEALFGEINPGGKLPVSIPRNVGQIPAYYNKFPGGDKEYRDSPVGPIFPFGHGLSYTTFSYTNLQVQATSFPSAIVSVDVQNTGHLAGDEVVQVYVRDEYSSVVRPVKELKRFQRFSLQPGEKRTVTFELDKGALAFYDDKSKDWIVEPGTFEITVGSSSRDIRATASLQLSK